MTVANRVAQISLAFALAAGLGGLGYVVVQDQVQEKRMQNPENWFPSPSLVKSHGMLLRENGWEPVSNGDLMPYHYNESGPLRDKNGNDVKCDSDSKPCAYICYNAHKENSADQTLYSVRVDTANKPGHSTISTAETYAARNSRLGLHLPGIR
jgi:hypothetical protein